MDIPDQAYLQQAESVTFREVGGEAVLLNLKTGIYYGLNEVGTFVWQHMDGEHTIDDLVGAICTTYAVDQKQAVTDVRRLAGELLEAGLARAS